jgi:hypothetical protein
MPSAFAADDFKKIEGDELKNPISLEILKKIEASKKKFEIAQELQQKRIEQQKLIDEQRTLAKISLQEELKRMDKKYDDFTPQNAFARYVSSMNSTHHGIYWDQFNYLQAKVTLAKEARDSVLQQGGTYTDAMKQYIKYAKMSKIEMLNVIRDLNIKYDFANEDIQSNFDVDGKLPRYENDLEAPCYGCTAKISKVQINSDQSVPIHVISLESKPTKIDELRDSLSELQKAFLYSKDVIAQKKMVFEMNQIVSQIQELK